MAKAKTSPQADAPAADAGDTPVKPTGPSIEYVDEGADKVEFTPSPNARTVKVFANGIVVESN